MSDKLNINTFTGGMDWDSHPSTVESTSYKYALNAITSDLYQDSFISNEHGSNLFSDLGSSITGLMYLQSKNSTLYFLDSGDLWLVSHKNKSKTFVCSDKEFGCNWHLDGCEWIEGVYKTMSASCNELIVYWSSACEYRWINLDEMLSEKRKAALKSSIKAGETCKSDPNCKEGCGDRTCDYFKLFKGVRAPRAIAQAYENGGTSALAGTYEVIARYKDTDGNTSNWFYFTDPVSLGSPHNIAGEKSYGHIQVKYFNLDCSYHALEIAVVSTMNGVENVQMFDLYYSSSNASFNYYGQKGRDGDISEILEKRKKTYVKGRSLFQDKSRLFPYRLKQERNLDWQSKVNNIKVEWVAYESTLDFAQRNNLKSFEYGESYAFAIGANYLDYTKSNLFHIPNGGGSVSSGNNTNNATTSFDRPTSQKNQGSLEPLESRNRTATTSNQGNDDQGTIPEFTYEPRKYKRDRIQKENKPGNPETPLSYEDRFKSAIQSIQADIDKLCVSDECRDCSTNLCSPNHTQVDQILNDWEDLLSELTEDKLDIKATIDYSPSSIKNAADKIIESIKKRERISDEKSTVSVTSTAPAVGKQDLEARGGAGNTYDGDGNLISNEQLKFVRSGSCSVKTEENIKYPYTENCDGGHIYGGLAGKNVRHFRMPSEKEVNYFKSGSVGVPSKETPQGDEHKDISVILLGIRFSNIILPTVDELPKELNKTNPYTIYMVERTDVNKSVLAKGLAIRTYEAPHKGATYVQSRHAVNSFETVDKTIDAGGKRMVTGATPHASFLFFSPDTMFRKLGAPITGIVDIGEVSGVGYRHNLYAEGIPPDNQLYGTKVDQRGTCQAVNLNIFTKGEANYESPIACTGSIFVDADSVSPSPSESMSKYSLSNRYKESCLWVGGQLPALKKGVTGEADASFVGDTLDYQAPIHNASANIVALVSKKPDQYGDLPNMAYIPILQSGGASSTIEGLCGDTFINPITIKRSGFVSDKVGNKFPIAGGTGTAPSRPSNKKEDRSVKDSPEDVVKSYVGMWYPTKLPKSGDVADAKNWAGLHTVGNQVRGWSDAKTKTEPESDYYYPKVVKTLVTFTCQSSVNTNLRVISDKFEEKFYPKLGQYYIGSDAPDKHDWKRSFLNLFGFEDNQPSLWKQTAKILIRTIIGVLMPMSQVHDLTDLTTVTSFGGYFVAAPMLAALWYQMNQVLFTNDWIDQMLGIPQLHTDDEGGEDDSKLHGFHDNFCNYNWSYSKNNNYLVDRGIPDPYYTCKCDDCMEGQTTNEIIFSNKQQLTSHIDSYKNFQALDYIEIPTDSGKLYRLFSNKNNLYAHTENGIYNIKEREIEPNSFQSGLYIEPYQIGENIPEGIYGLIDPKASIATQYGYFWIDRQARKVYHFDESIVEISAYRMHNFFKDYLNFCSSSNCVDEKTSGIFYSMGVDPRLNRLLLTKNDPSGSWTISYSFLKKKWISFHSYIPKAYVWDRDNIYSIKGSEVWIHANNDEGDNGDNSTSRFQNFFGQSYPYIIDFVVKENPDSYLNAFEFNSLVLDTQAQHYDSNGPAINGRKETFDQIALWNSYQTSGLNNIVLKDTENTHENISQHVGVCKVDYQHNQFRINELFDCTMDYCSPITQYSKCNPQLELCNYDATNALKPNMRLQDTFMNVRLILNKNNIKLYTRYILTNIQKKVR